MHNQTHLKLWKNMKMQFPVSHLIPCFCETAFLMTYRMPRELDAAPFLSCSVILLILVKSKLLLSLSNGQSESTRSSIGYVAFLVCVWTGLCVTSKVAYSLFYWSFPEKSTAVVSTDSTERTSTVCWLAP